MKKVIVITGGATGLGMEITRKLSIENDVIILSRTESKLKEMSEQVGCKYMVCDIRSYDSVSQTVNKILEQYGKIDCLINNAGLWIRGNLVSNSPKDIEKVIDVNTKGTINMTRAVMPNMINNKDGLVINIISSEGIDVEPLSSVYSASKWAITGFTKNIQIEAARNGVRVVGMYPGLMGTRFFEKAGYYYDMSTALNATKVADIVTFLMTLDKNILIPEIGIRDIRNY